jgi:hypothetical protein
VRRAGARRVACAAWAFGGTPRAIVTGAACALGAVATGACHKDPVVTIREVTLHAPRSCAAGIATLDANAYGIFHALGDFEPPASATGHVLGDVGTTLSELDTATRAVVVDATEADRPWQGQTDIAAAGPIDLLLLPALSSCALSHTFDAGAHAGSALAPVGGQRVLVVGGTASAPPPTLVMHLDTGSIDPVSPDLLTPRTGASVTAFGAGALVAGGFDSRNGGEVLDKAEVYDPVLGGFDQQHFITLSTQRANLGAVVLVTGETLLVGGVGGDGKRALDSMEVVDPVTRTVRAENVAQLAVARSAPTVLRLASGEILVAGGVDTNGVAVPTIEWFSPDATRATKRAEDLVTGSVRTYVALESGGALAVIAPPASPPPMFQNTWLIDPDGVFEPATPIAGALADPILFGGAGGSPVLWTGDRWLRWAPWSGSFAGLDVLDDAPAHVAGITASPDPGLGLWLDGKSGSPTALRFDTRNEYSTLSGPLLVSDTVDIAPDRLVGPGTLTFDPDTGLILDSGSSAFVVDRTYADIDVTLDAPTGEPAELVLRDELGVELEVGGIGCPGAIESGSRPGSLSTLSVQRRGSAVTWSVSGKKPPQACTPDVGDDARLSIGVRGAAALSRSVARNLRITRIGSL